MTGGRFLFRSIVIFLSSFCTSTPHGKVKNDKKSHSRHTGLTSVCVSVWERDYLTPGNEATQERYSAIYATARSYYGARTMLVAMYEYV